MKSKIISKVKYAFIISIFLLIIASCGSDNEADIDENNSCKLQLITGDCNYSEFEYLELTKGYFIDVGPSEYTGTNGVTHFFRKIIFSDGDLILDNFGNIESDNATAYVEFFLYSLGAERFKSGTFRPWAGSIPVHNAVMHFFEINNEENNHETHNHYS